MKNLSSPLLSLVNRPARGDACAFSHLPHLDLDCPWHLNLKIFWVESGDFLFCFCHGFVSLFLAVGYIYMLVLYGEHAYPRTQQAYVTRFGLGW